MPKRIRSGSIHKSKKSRQSASESANKRNLPSRSCKITSASRKGIVDFNFLSIPTNMGSNQTKHNEKVKDKNKVKEDAASISSDELDVVYDLQEDKKNKIYEVITVMSDDETPNQISYERIYAEDPNKRFVDEAEIKAILSKDPIQNKVSINENDIVGEIVKEANMIKEKIANSMGAENDCKEKPKDYSMMAVSMDTKDDSDNDVICLAVLDAKTKAEQKKATIEEICLSSDSELEIEPKVPPIRLHLPFAGFPYVNKYHYRPTNENENSLGSTNSGIVYPYRSKQNEISLSEWESNSTNSKASSSDGFSTGRSESPRALSCDDSSSTPLSDLIDRQNLSPRSTSSDNENPSNPSSPNTEMSEEEEKDDNWKGRQ